MAYSEADLAAIQGKKVSGVAGTRDRDQSVEFRSLQDLNTIEAEVQADVDAAAGIPHLRFRRIAPRVGH